MLKLPNQQLSVLIFYIWCISLEAVVYCVCISLGETTSKYIPSVPVLEPSMRVPLAVLRLTLTGTQG